MTIASDLTRIKNAKTAIRQAIIDKGVDVPETDLISTYSGYIDQISTSVGPDPKDPTLANLKLALSTDDPASIYPVGTEVPDAYDGNPNPLIVAQYLDSTNNSAYGGAEGVILVRKYILDTEMPYDSANNKDYVASSINAWLNSEHLGLCSESLSTLISSLSITYNTGATGTTIAQTTAKAFLMSSTEILGIGVSELGVAWDYWKQKTGLTTANNAANVGRAVTKSGGEQSLWWLRQWVTRYYVSTVEKGGSLAGTGSSVAFGILPAYFIAKD